MHFLTSLLQNQQFISDVGDRASIDKDLGPETFDPQGLPTGAKCREEWRSRVPNLGNSGALSLIHSEAWFPICAIISFGGSKQKAAVK